MSELQSAQFTLRQATPEDVDSIAGLVNRAFEVERFFKNADRTDSEQIRTMMKDGAFLLLMQANQVAASVYVKLNGKRGYIGLLSVEPRQQRLGLGKRLMREAEDYAREAGCKVADIRTVNLRTELPPLYRKMGYVETGIEAVGADSIQKFTQPVHFIRMSKPL